NFSLFRRLGGLPQRALCRMLPARTTRKHTPLPGTPDPAADSSRHIALYIQLASIFRHKILSQTWPSGFKLPALDVLAAEFKVARITVRQAVALLVRENLLSSSRGRGTFVLPAENRRASMPIDPMGSPQGHRILVTSTSERLAMPPDFQGDCGVYDRYTLVEKTHLEDDRPFATMQIYVPTVLYKRLSRKQIEKRKILSLMLDSGDVAETLEQIMTVEPADYYLSE